MKRSMQQSLITATTVLVLALQATGQEVVEAEDLPEAPPVEMAVTVEMPELEAAVAEQGAASTELAALRAEVTALRVELRQLQDTLDLLVTQVMADLETENDQLRGEVRRMYQRADAGLSGVPRPGADLINDVLQEDFGEGEIMAYAAGAEVDAPRELPFLVINEWGRSPEAAAALPGDVPSLAGLVGAVPPGSRKVDVEALGRKLREDYAAYDNINVEIFDNEDAAAFYAETNVSDPVHRILSISKHAASGRDVILLLENGEPTEVAF